jgi:hypothetical protein
MPTTPPPTCHKCGAPAPDDAANRSGWLIAQRKNAPEGYLIVRCPDHITKHALMLAGLPQQDSRERIMKLIERGLEYEVEPGKRVSAIVKPCANGDTAHVLYQWEDIPGKVGPVSKDYFDSFDELLTAMREVQPDMRRWSTIK